METIVFIGNSCFRNLRARANSFNGPLGIPGDALARPGGAFAKLGLDWAKCPFVKMVAEAGAPWDRAGVPAGKCSAILSTSLQLPAE